MRLSATWRTVYLVPLILLAGWLWGSCQRQAGAAEAKRDVEQKADQAIADSSRAWLARWESVKRDVANAEARANAAASKALVLRRKRQALPLPPPTAPDTALVTYWRTRALDAEAEAGKWQIAFDEQKRATARLKPAADTGVQKLATTTTNLERSFTRENHQGLRLPKLPVAAAGCVLGSLMLRDDLAGCLGGGLTLTVALPTR